MISAWTKHLTDDEDKERFRNKVLSSKVVLERQRQLLKEMEADLDTYESATKQYDNVNWGYRQADNNGFRRCLKAIDKLLTLDLKENTSGRQPTPRPGNQ